MPWVPDYDTGGSFWVEDAVPGINAPIATTPAGPSILGRIGNALGSLADTAIHVGSPAMTIGRAVTGGNASLGQELAAGAAVGASIAGASWATAAPGTANYIATQATQAPIVGNAITMGGTMSLNYNAAANNPYGQAINAGLNVLGQALGPNNVVGSALQQFNTGTTMATTGYTISNRQMARQVIRTNGGRFEMRQKLVATLAQATGMTPQVAYHTLKMVMQPYRPRYGGFQRRGYYPRRPYRPYYRPYRRSYSRYFRFG